MSEKGKVPWDSINAAMVDELTGKGKPDTIPVPASAIADLVARWRFIEERMERPGWNGPAMFKSEVLEFGNALRAVVGEKPERPEKGVEVSDNPAPGGEGGR